MTPLHISIHSNINLTEIERYISVNDKISFTCRECGKNSIVSKRFHNIIAFETEPYVHHRGKKYCISQLKEEICVNGDIYTLLGVIENNPIIEHFVAYVRRNNGIWQSIDDLKNKIDTSKRITITPMLIYMLFYKKQGK